MRFGDKVRVARMRWCAHVQRRDSGHIRLRMLNIELTTKEIHGCNEEGHRVLVGQKRMLGARGQTDDLLWQPKKEQLEEEEDDEEESIAFSIHVSELHSSLRNKTCDRIKKFITKNKCAEKIQKW